MTATTECEICRFNFDPASYAEDSWLEAFGDSRLLARIRDSRRGRPFLSRHLFDRLDLLEGGLWDEPRDPDRLALVAPAALQQLVLKAGLCLTADAIRARVDGDAVRGLIDALGHRLYAFALHDAARLATQSELAQMPLDRQDDDPGRHEPDLVRIRRQGMQVLAAATRDLSRGVLQRLLLKLPRTWSDGYVVLLPAIPANSARGLLRRILEEEADDARPRDHDRVRADA